jgi:hypothetical protein
MSIVKIRSAPVGWDKGVYKECDEEAEYSLCNLYESDGEYCYDFSKDASGCEERGKVCSSNVCLAGECCLVELRRRTELKSDQS